MTKVGDIAKIHMGYTFRGSLKNSTEGNTAVIQMRDAWQSAISQSAQFARTDLAHVQQHYLLCPGDIIFRSRGQTTTAALISAPLNHTICIAPLMFIRISQPDLVLPAYLQWFINLSSTQTQIDRLAHGGVVRMISAESMRGLDLLLPGLQEQRKIIAIRQMQQHAMAVRARLVEKDHACTELALLQYARRSAMQAHA